MALSDHVDDLAERIAQEFNTVREEVQGRITISDSIPDDSVGEDGDICLVYED